MVATAAKSAKPAKSAKSANSASAGLKTLVIAEKPSVAADFTKVLPDKFVKEKTHYEGKDYIISYAVGHLLTISDPGEMDERYKSWKLDYLPIIPDVYPLKPIDGNKSQLSALAKLIRRKDVGTIVNACDAGREGELIFYYIMQHVQAKRDVNKVIKRLWLQSMTAASIKKSFAALRDAEDMQNLQNAAISRSEADWLVGINGSRGLTAWNSQHGGFRLTPTGRVQTPTLSLIVNREEDRISFIPEDYWTIEADFAADGQEYRGRWFDEEKSKSESAKTAVERITEEAKANAIVEQCKGKSGVVEETSKPSSQSCPPLYDLTTLQREANGRFGFSAKRTLQIAQALYERHKLTTYPRTDSRALPEDYLSSVKDTVKNMERTALSQYAREALDKNYIRFDKRIFNNAKISDHHAIIPTGSVPKDLPDAEAKIFTMIAQRFLGVFFPPARYQNTLRLTRVEDQVFRTEGKVLIEAGWRAVYGNAQEGQDVLAALPENAKPAVKAIEALADQTRPPARYTESSLLSIMESAGKLVDDEELKDALKERGLGTPATRAAIIEKLISDKYLLREGKELVPTSKAFDLIRLTRAMSIEDLTSAELTGEWEHKLSQIEKGEYTREQFMEEIRTLTRKVVTRIRDFDEEKTRKEAQFSPVNGQKYYETVSRWESEDGEIRIRKMLGGRLMEESEVKDLLEKRKIGPLTGFRSKRGSAFAAVIILNDQNKVEFVFEDDTASADGEEFDINKETPLGNSPVDGSPVYETLTSYVSKSGLDKEPQGLRLSKTILGATISRENVIKMLNGEKTDLIKGFRSSRTKRLFDAYLKLSNKGKMEFEFPPRKFSGKKKASKKKPS